MGKPQISINGRSFSCNTESNVASHHALLKYLASCRNKSNNTSSYPSDDSEIVADDKSTPAHQSNLNIMLGNDGWLRPQICAKRKKVTSVQTINCHAWTLTRRML